jgi:hypothetical protein
MIKTYKIFIGNREYTDYYYVDTNTLKKEKLMLNPIKCKFLNQDIFTYEKYSINTLHSSIQKSEHIPGVLVLQTKNTYGKIKNKFLYKCIPDDKRLPIFLIPYSINYGFNKIVNNKYITFKYKSWVNKFPIGTISQTIGDVSILTNFYEYNLYCKSLYASITYFKKEAMKKLREKSSKYFIEQIQKKYNPEIRHNVNVFAIDPKNSKDYDDAFSIQKKEKTTIISIYIANVAFWLDIMDLWSSFSKRIATIYLPDRKRPMLPTMLSDALCSLIQGQIRYALTLDLEFDNETYEFIDYKFVNTSIILKKNFVYDTPEQENYKDYKYLLTFIRNLNNKYIYLDKINDSHDVVAYLMIYMNYMSAKELIKYKCGIYRSAKLNSAYIPPDNIPPNVQKFLKMWNSFGGKYCNYNNLESHDMLDLDAYVHITSPIRRLADLLNLLDLQNSLNLFTFNVNSQKFYDSWTNKESMEYINTTMKSIRKVQNDCSLLNICANNTEILNKVHEGYIFDKIKRNDDLYQYIIYIPELKMTNRLTCRFIYDNYTKHNFKIYIFMDEIRLKQKIRLEII